MTLGRAAAAEAIGTAFAARHCGWVGDHGRAARSRKRGHRLAGEFHRHWSRSLCVDRYLRACSGAHFNPVVSAVSVWDGRSRRCDCRLCPGAGWRGFRGRRGSARDVRTVDRSDFGAYSANTG